MVNKNRIKPKFCFREKWNLIPPSSRKCNALRWKNLMLSCERPPLNAARLPAGLSSADKFTCVNVVSAFCRKKSNSSMTVLNIYRPQRSCEGYVFTGVRLSTGGGSARGGLVPGPGGLISQHALRQTPTPRERWLLLWMVCILLECILVAQ